MIHVAVMLAVTAAWLADGPAYAALVLALAAYLTSKKDPR